MQERNVKVNCFCRLNYFESWIWIWPIAMVPALNYRSACPNSSPSFCHMSDLDCSQLVTISLTMRLRLHASRLLIHDQWSISLYIKCLLPFTGQILRCVFWSTVVA